MAKSGRPDCGPRHNDRHSTFNNDQGNLAVDPLTHNVYDIYATGQAGTQKGTSAAFNNIIASSSTDVGATWTANSVYTAPLFTSLNNVFPSLAVDSATGKLYAGPGAPERQIQEAGKTRIAQIRTPASTATTEPSSLLLSPS